MHTDISLGSVANKNDATCLNVDGGGGGGGASPPLRERGPTNQQINKKIVVCVCVCAYTNNFHFLVAKNLSFTHAE